MIVTLFGRLVLYRYKIINGTNPLSYGTPVQKLKYIAPGKE